MKRGEVHISKVLWEREPGEPLFVGVWEVEEQLAEEGPGWETAEEAIAWGRERAAEVYVRLGATGESIYWAGDGSPPPDPYYPNELTAEPWPPGGWRGEA